MRRDAPTEPPVALTVAGSDSGGGAGIQADLAAMTARGVFGTSAITAVTAQNTEGVEGSHALPVEVVEGQLEAVGDDLAPGATKTGMLATAPIVRAVAEWVAPRAEPLVVDPVMVAASGDRLLEPAAEDAYGALLAAATLVTPNADEAAVLTDVEVTDEDSAAAAGRALLEAGCEAALVKGGHVPGERVTDVLVTGSSTRTFTHRRVDTEATHGSGCVLSAAIAADLARGRDLETAVEEATALLARAVRYHYAVGEGPGAVNPGVELRDRAARAETGAAVRSVVRGLLEADVGALVPEVGMNVAGATPAAETVGEVAAVDGRIVGTLEGPRAAGPVRFGASSHVARFLLAAREHEPALRFAANCRFDGEIEDALDALGWPVASYDRDAEPPPVSEREGETMGWGAGRAFAGRSTTPVAIVDRGAVGKEPITKVVATGPDALLERVLELADRVG